MRILAGIYRGRTLKTVPDLTVRPATGRVRQTVFDMLTHRLDFEGLRVLDLFAGSGSLGFEALSRGAAHVTFVEQDRDAAWFLGQNAGALGCEGNVEILQMDALGALEAAPEGRYGLVFADPPYSYPGTAEIPARVLRTGRLARGGYLLIEHPSALRFPEDPLYEAGPVKKFGRTLVTFFHHRRGEQ